MIKKPNRTMVELECTFCNESYARPKSQVSAGRAKFCSLQCAGKAKIIGKVEIKKRHAIYLKKKMENDPEFREKRLARKRALYFEKRESNLEKMKLRRETVEYKEYRKNYLAQEKYKNYKHVYDRKLRAKKKFGEFAEAHLALLDLDKEVKKKMSAYEIRIATGRYGRTQREKRNYEKSKRGNFKSNALGNIKPS